MGRLRRHQVSKTNWRRCTPGVGGVDGGASLRIQNTQRGSRHAPHRRGVATNGLWRKQVSASTVVMALCWDKGTSPCWPLETTHSSAATRAELKGNPHHDVCSGARCHLSLVLSTLARLSGESIYFHPCVLVHEGGGGVNITLECINRPPHDLDSLIRPDAAKAWAASAYLSWQQRLDSEHATIPSDRRITAVQQQITVCCWRMYHSRGRNPSPFTKSVPPISQSHRLVLMMSGSSHCQLLFSQRMISFIPSSQDTHGGKVT